MNQTRRCHIAEPEDGEGCPRHLPGPAVAGHDRPPRWPWRSSPATWACLSAAEGATWPASVFPGRNAADAAVREVLKEADAGHGHPGDREQGATR